MCSLAQDRQMVFLRYARMYEFADYSVLRRIYCIHDTCTFLQGKLNWCDAMCRRLEGVSELMLMGRR